jgi:hypothetical protein
MPTAMLMKMIRHRSRPRIFAAGIFQSLALLAVQFPALAAPSLRPPERGQSMVLCYLRLSADLAGLELWRESCAWSMPARFIM